MKQRIGLILVGVVALVGIIIGERRKADVSVSSAPIFNLIGDTQQELTRLPIVLTKLSDEEEIRIGNELARSYDSSLTDEQKKDGFFTDAQSYVQQVGLRVSAHARRKLPYKFHYLPNSWMMNAFSLPGGHVFIGQGLVSKMDSEDELAAVLGHEVEHIDLGHCAERVQIEARLRRLNLELPGVLVMLPYQIFAAGYTKEQEFAADADGTQLAVSAGYSPNGAVRMFDKFAEMEPKQKRPSSPQEELSQVAEGSLSEYFRTHPPSKERGDRIRQMIVANNWPVPAERELRVAYIVLTADAQAALANYDYPRAIATAERSLKANPKQRIPYEVMYSANMYSANFDAALDAIRHIAADSHNPEDAHKYSEALAAAKGGKAAVDEFQTWWRSLQRMPIEQPGLETEVAGLELLAGNEQPIQAIGDRYKPSWSSQSDYAETTRTAGNALARAGHWYNRAGQYEKALSYLERARELYPGQPSINLEYAWAALQMKNIGTAQSMFWQSSSEQQAHAGLAVSLWLSEDKSGAVEQYRALEKDPKWRNAKWVGTTFGDNIFAELEAVRAEAEKRSKARK